MNRSTLYKNINMVQLISYYFLPTNCIIMILKCIIYHEKSVLLGDRSGNF